MDSRWETKHFWFSLLALGFDTEKRRENVKLGRNMFDTPNREAFAVISHFLFTKLNKHRAKEIFRERNPEVTVGTNPEFRKQCCKWLKEISTQGESTLPRITPSSLISPAGVKFVHTVYQFARHVMIEDMKKLSVGTGILFAEAVKLRPEDMYMAKARQRVANNKLLQILQKEAYVIQEYEKKTPILITEIEQMKIEYALLQIQSQRMKQNYQNKRDTIERIQKVRSMWTFIMEMLTSLKKDKEVVDSVLEDCVHRCILDGTDVILSVPRLLIQRVESDKQELFTSSLYEGGKLNFLAVILLLNEALRMLRDEHYQSELEELHRIENIVTSCHEALQDLNMKRLRRKQQHCVSVHEAICRKQEDWKMKWKSFLYQCPFDLILKVDLDLSSTSSPLQSPNLPEEDEDSILRQYLASGSDIYDSLHQDHYEKDEEALATGMDKSSLPPKWDLIQHGFFSSDSTDRPFLCLSGMSSVPSKLSEVSANRDLLTENNLRTETCEGSKKPIPQKIVESGEEECPISEVQEKAGEDVVQTKSPVEKDFLEKARDELAEEVAKAVMSESPGSGEKKGMVLDDFIRSLCLNPFIPSKEVPRTPVNLFSEIRRERKAVQIEGSLDVELSSTEVMTEEASKGARAIMQEAMDSSFMSCVAVSPVLDSETPLSEKMFQLSSTESSSQDLGGVSHIFESSDSKTSGMQETERTEAQELDCTALSGSSAEDLKQALLNVENSVSAPNICLEDSIRTNVLPSDHSQSFLMDRMSCRGHFSWLSSLSHESILDEQLLKYDSMDLSISTDLDSVFSITDSANTTSVLENNEDTKKSDLDLQSPSNSCKVLKKTAPESEEGLHQTHNGGESESCRSDQSPALEERERNELCSPVVVVSLDEEFTKTPLSKSPSERKYSLSSLLTPSDQLEEMASMAHDIPLDLLCKLKDQNS